MSDQHIMNTTFRDDLFEKIWISCLFAPIVVLYVFILGWIGSVVHLAEAIPWIKNINEILGYGLGTLLLAGVQIASNHSKNDFIAGPIEQLNLYTFFFLGMVTGGLIYALLFTALYEMLETYGLPAIVKSISANERVKAISLGMSQRDFVIFQFILNPLKTVVSMVLTYYLIVFLLPSEMIVVPSDLVSQIRGLTIFIAMWAVSETFISSLFSKTSPNMGCIGLVFSLLLLSTAYRLNIKDWQSIILYSILIISGWVLVIYFIVLSIKNAKPMVTSKNIKTISWR